MNKDSFYTRFGLTILVVAVFFLPLVFRGARKALESNRNDVKQWLPETYAETQVYRQFREEFANEEFILVSWHGCTLDDSRLELLADKLVPPVGQRPAHGQPGLFESAVTGPRIIARMTAPPLSLPREEAIDRLAGSLVGHDRQTTCMVLTLGPEGKGSFRRAVEAVYQVAEEHCAISRDAMRLGGPPVDNVAIDKAGEQSLLRLALLSAVVGVVVSWWSLRSGRLMVMVFATAIYSVLASMAVVYYSGREVNAILLTMPSLVYVATTSGAIHMANYYRDRIREHGLSGAPGHAIRHAALPLALAASTTAVGLLTLCLSELVPIQMFGFYAAVGVLISLVVTFLVMPSALELWPLAREAQVRPAGESQAGAAPQSRLQRFWCQAGELVARRYGWASLACLALMIACAAGIFQTRTSVQLMRLFSPGARILEDYAWLEQNLGELVPMEVVLRVEPDESRLTLLERLELVEHVQKRVERLPSVGSALSAVTFAPPLNDPKRREAAANSSALTLLGGSRVIRSTLNRKLEENYEELLKGDYLRVSDGKVLWPEGEELWRITARIEALGDVDYGTFVHDIAATVDPVLAVYRERARILEQLAQQGRRPGGCQILIVGVQDQRQPANADSQAMLLMDTLTKVGARVHYHDPQVPDLAASAYDSLWSQTSQELTPELLAAQDLVVVTSDREGIDLASLRRHAPRSLSAFDRLSRPADDAAGSEMLAGLGSTYTGLVPLVYKAQHSLLDNLIFGYFTDMALIAVTMMIVVQNIAAGVVLFIACAFPAAIIFGLMGWLGVVVDTGTVMAPSVALGVTVDDIVHFMLWYRRGQQEGLSRPQSVMLAYRGCARAMYQSWGVIGLGLSIFAVSPFVPTQRFGMLMLTLLTAALIGNLVLLPALLAGPLGGLFGRRSARQLERRPLVDQAGGPITQAEAEPGRAEQPPIAGPHALRPVTGRPAGTPHSGNSARQTH